MARLPYTDVTQWPQASIDALSVMRPLNVFKMIAWAQTLAPPVFETVNAILGATQLDPRLRQFAILKVGYLCQSAYEIHHHERVSRAAGLTEEEIEVLKRGEGLERLGHRERMVVRFADEMTTRIRVSDQTFAQVKAFLPEREVVELTMIVGFYNMICRFLETLDIDVETRSGKQSKMDPNTLPDLRTPKS